MGDSCAHIVTASGTEKLTYDHKGSDPAERARIEATGSMIIRDRIEGMIAVTRAIGDSVFREYGLIHTPYTRKIALTPGSMIVLASDGLWDVVKPEDLIPLKDLKAEEIAVELVNDVIERESKDNTTIIVLKI